MHATETSLPLVSIIMPAFNGEPYIGAAIRSVLAQSYARWELLILDDGSADRTAEIAEAFEKSPFVSSCSGFLDMLCPLECGLKTVGNC